MSSELFSRRLAFGLALAPWLACCSNEPTPDQPPDVTSALSIELGAGRTAFSPFDDASPSLEVVSGPQGGWHLELTLRLVGYDGNELMLDYLALADTGESLGFPASYVVSAQKLLPVSDGSHHRLGDRVVLQIEGPDRVANQQIEVSCDASLDGVSLAYDARSVWVRDEVDELR